MPLDPWARRSVNQAERSYVVHVQGTAQMHSTRAFELSSEEEIVFRVKDSAIRLTPKGIFLESANIQLSGEGGRFAIDAKSASIRTAESSCEFGKQVLLKANLGSALSMGKEVKLDGGKILLNSPLKSQDPEITAPPSLPTHLEILDSEGVVLAHQPFVITLEDGSRKSGALDEKGQREILLDQGGSLQLPGISKIMADGGGGGAGSSGGGMKPRVIREGEFLVQLATRYGFDPNAVWQHPKNAPLVAKRTDPNILAPGDVLFIPQSGPGEPEVVMGQVNRYRVTIPTTQLRWKLQGQSQRLANAHFLVMGAYRPIEGTTTGEGLVDVHVPVTARRLTLVFPDHDRRNNILPCHSCGRFRGRG